MLKLKIRKLNLLDIGVIVLILSILAGLLWIRTSRKSQWINLRLVVSNDDWWWEGSPPQWWYAEELVAGQSSRNSFGEKIAEITDVESFDIGEYRRRIFVELKVKGTYDKRREAYLFNYQPIQIGKSLDLTFGKYNVRGIVTYIDATFQEYKPRVIEVKLSAVRPWVSDSFKEGLQMKDTSGRTLAEILSVSISPSRVERVTELGNEVEKTFPGYLFDEVILRVQILTFQSGGVDYFVDRAAIKAGNRIWFQFPQTVAREAEIIRIVE